MNKKLLSITIDVQELELLLKSAEQGLRTTDYYDFCKQERINNIRKAIKESMSKEPKNGV
jgi:hypothetical protein